MAENDLEEFFEQNLRQHEDGSGQDDSESSYISTGQEVVANNDLLEASNE